MDYDKIQNSIDEYSKYILSCIKNEYANSLTPSQNYMINDLLNKKSFVIVEKPNEQDLEFFSKQEGITDPSKYSYDYVPSGHGGRTKEDNLIHIYPYSKSFEKCSNEDEVIKSCMTNIVTHEIFHYFIRPDISNNEEFGHFLTEGLVQYYSVEFAKNHRLEEPKSNYDKNVEAVKKLISGFSDDLNVSKNIFSLSVEELLNLSSNGDEIYKQFTMEKEYHQEITNLIIDSCKAAKIDPNSDQIRGIIKHYEKMSDLNILSKEIKNNFQIIFQNDELNMKKFIDKLNSLESTDTLTTEMKKYEERMKEFLPIEKKVKKLKRSGMSDSEIASTIGPDNMEKLNQVPGTLYHGSQQSLDVIKARESTQKGSYVYATDNPIHALFFSIFRNSSEARANINEYIDENGEYKVKYEIDERIDGALDRIIDDRNITIHVCNGNDFFKPQGLAYISREWCSKEGTDIVPTDKIQVNVKDFFEKLEEQNLVEYSRYSKDKDWKTVIDLLGQNYPFGLGTQRGQDVSSFDSMYDEFIQSNFPEQYEFSSYLRDDIKKIMSSNDGENSNDKLKKAKMLAYSFLGKDSDSDIAKINDYLEKQREQYQMENESKTK